jgi:hypothetical protein
MKLSVVTESVEQQVWKIFAYLRENFEAAVLQHSERAASLQLRAVDLASPQCVNTRRRTSAP